MADLQPLFPRKISQSIFAPIAPDAAPPPLPVPPPTMAGPNPDAQRVDGYNADIVRHEPHGMPTTTMGKIGHVAAGIGNALGNIFAPSAMSFIPGTQLGNERIVDRDESKIKDISDRQTEEAARKQTAAQTALTEAQPGLMQQRIDATRLANHAKYSQLAAKAGQVMTVDPETGEAAFTDDPTSQAYKDRVALADMHQGTANYDAIKAENSDQRYKPGTPQYVEWKQRLDNQAQANQVRMGALGLSRERLGFQEDKTYNPQPTSQERNKGDMGNSAVDQIHTMRTILATHPEFAGPAAGATQAFQRWLSSSGEDAGRFLAARQYLADHSAAVFGGRGEYISKQMEGLTSPNFSPSTLGGVLDQAEETAGRFTKAGQTHNKAGVLQPQQSATPTTERYERVNGKLVKVDK